MDQGNNASRRGRVSTVLAAAAFLTIAAAPAAAQSAASFYSGKLIRFIIPDGVGGGYDAYSRILARHLADHIPGHPRIVPENMPGANGIVATNWLYNAAPRDGSVMGSTYNALLTDPLLGNPVARYDPTKFAWIGSITTQYSTCMVWNTSPIQTIEDATKREVRVSTTGLAGNSGKLPLMLNTLLGTKFKVIAGYTTSGMRLAVERGEVEGICGVPYDTYAAANPEWLRDNKIRFILQVGPKALKDLPDVPLLIDYVKGPLERAALTLLNVNQDVGRPQMFPPNVPDYLVTAVRTAFDETMQDPQFLADAQKQHIEPAPMTGAAVEAEIKQSYGAPKDVVALAAKLWPAGPAQHKE